MKILKNLITTSTALLVGSTLALAAQSNPSSSLMLHYQVNLRDQPEEHRLAVLDDGSVWAFFSGGGAVATGTGLLEPEEIQGLGDKLDLFKGPQPLSIGTPAATRQVVSALGDVVIVAPTAEQMAVFDELDEVHFSVLAGERSDLTKRFEVKMTQDELGPLNSAGMTFLRDGRTQMWQTDSSGRRHVTSRFSLSAEDSNDLDVVLNYIGRNLRKHRPQLAQVVISPFDGPSYQPTQDDLSQGWEAPQIVIAPFDGPSAGAGNSDLDNSGSGWQAPQITIEPFDGPSIGIGAAPEVEESGRPRLEVRVYDDQNGSLEVFTVQDATEAQILNLVLALMAQFLP
jgi:hypothetical protein